MKSFCLLILFLNPPSFSFSCHGYATRGCNEASRESSNVWKEKGGGDFDSAAYLLQGVSGNNRDFYHVIGIFGVGGYGSEKTCEPC